MTDPVPLVRAVLLGRHGQQWSDGVTHLHQRLAEIVSSTAVEMVLVMMV